MTISFLYGDFLTEGTQDSPQGGIIARLERLTTHAGILIRVFGRVEAFLSRLSVPLGTEAHHKTALHPLEGRID